MKWDGRYVAGVSKVSALKRTTEVVKHREGGDPSSSRKSPGRTEYEAITLERGVTHDTEFEQWANKVWNFGAGLGAEVSLQGLPQGHHHRGLQRGRPARDRLQGLPLLGLGVPGAARPRRQRQRRRDPAHQARERGLGARLRRARADRADLHRALARTPMARPVTDVEPAARRLGRRSTLERAADAPAAARRCVLAGGRRIGVDGRRSRAGDSARGTRRCSTCACSCSARAAPSADCPACGERARGRRSTSPRSRPRSTRTPTPVDRRPLPGAPSAADDRRPRRPCADRRRRAAARPALVRVAVARVSDDPARPRRSTAERGELDAVRRRSPTAHDGIDVEPGAACDACGHEWVAPFDIGAFLVREVDAWAERLLREVHVLAARLRLERARRSSRSARAAGGRTSTWSRRP